MRRLTILCYKDKADLEDRNVNHIINGHPQIVGERFISIVKEHMENGLCVAIASYGDTIIKLTGHLIAKGVLESARVKWIICDADKKVDGKPMKGGYNDDGRLIDWSYGYFIPSDDIINNAFNK